MLKINLDKNRGATPGTYVKDKLQKRNDIHL